MWIVSLLVPVTAIVQVGGGILQGAQDFDYQVKRKLVRRERREGEKICTSSKTITDARVYIHFFTTQVFPLIFRSRHPSFIYTQARVMGLCVLLSGGLLHLTTQGGGAGRSAGGQLLPVWLSLLVFQSLRALGFAWRFWKDPKYVYWGGRDEETKEKGKEQI